MKKFWVKLLLIFIMASVSALGFLQCHKPKSESEPGKTDERSALYTCPMHPEVVQSGPGKCPICGMNLVPKADAPRK